MLNEGRSAFFGPTLPALPLLLFLDAQKDVSGRRRWQLEMLARQSPAAVTVGVTIITV